MCGFGISLEGSARTWLENRPRGYYRSWEDLEYDFEKNFSATCKRPASSEELQSCKQDKGEALRSYIQRWTSLKNSAINVSDESAIRSFKEGVRRKELKEEFGRQKPKTIGEMMEIARDVIPNKNSALLDKFAFNICRSHRLAVFSDHSSLLKM